MDGFVNVVVIIVMIVVAVAYYQFKGKLPDHIPTKEERDAAQKRHNEKLDLLSLTNDSAIQQQYIDHYMFQGDAYKTDWMKQEYREYCQREWEEYKTLGYPKKLGGKDVNLAAFTYCRCFAMERMIRDKAVMPAAIYGGRWTSAADPLEAAVKECWWAWRYYHHEELVRHFIKTGEFIPSWKWKPLKEIPDWRS